MTTKDTVALALEALEKIACLTQTENLLWWQVEAREAITAIKQAQLKEKCAFPEVCPDHVHEFYALQATDSTCKETLRLQGKVYPRTCKKCGLGPCVGKPIEQAQEPRVKLIPTADEMGTPIQPQAITAENGQAQELVGYVSKQHGKLLIKDTLTNPNETEEGGYVWKLVTWVNSTPRQEKAS